MYMTQLVFDAYNREAVNIFFDCYRLHQMLYEGFSGSGRILFRVEPERAEREKTVIVISEELNINTDVLLKLKNIKSRSYNPNIVDGGRYHFRLRANPTIMQDKKRHALKAEKDQLGWINRKGADGGFSVTDIVAVDENMIAGTRQGQKMMFKSVLFQGDLMVTDTILFRESLFKGIGSAKGFGFGLLSIARL